MNDPLLPELNPEELARRLDISMASGKLRLHPERADDPRIEVARMLANAQHPAMSPEMSARIQAKVIAAHRQKMRTQRATRPQYTMVYRWAAVLAAAMVIFSAAAMPTVANSVPGELLYPIKRNLENIEVLIASSSARAEVHLTQAERRISEVQVLLQRKIFDADLMIDAHTSLTNYEQSTRELGMIFPGDEARAAGVTESIALLLQEAEQLQLVSGDEVVALIPTVIAIPTTPSAAVAPIFPPTSTPTPTQTATPTPSVTLSPTQEPSATATVAVVEQTELPVLQPSLTDEPTLVPTNTMTYTPEASSTPTASNTPLPTPSATQQQPIVTMYALENTNVRSRPARNQPIIAVLRQGEAVQVTGEDDTGKWWHLRLADGRSGWAAKFLLSLDKPVLDPTGGDGSNGGDGDGSNGGDFGCEHSGNYCYAPGQDNVQPTPKNGNDHPGGPPSNPGGGKP
jgi:hypothetical protein